MRRLPFHYAWVVLAATMLVIVTMAGFRSVVGIFVEPLQEEFGWSTATIGLAAGLNLMIYGMGAPFAGAAYARFGLRRCVLVAVATVAVGSLATLAMTQSWQFTLLWGVVNGTATGAVAITLAAVVANRWFVARAGLATGVLSAGNATGQLVFLPLLAWLTASYGWRYAVAAVGLIALGIVLPVTGALLRDRPSSVGLRAYGATEDDEPEPATGGLFLAALGDGLFAVAGSRTFLLLSGSFFVCGATTYGLIGTHLIPAAVGQGMTEVKAASLLAMIGVFDLVGTIASGWLTDRYDPRKLLLGYYGLRGLALLALPVVLETQGAGLIAFVVFYGLDWVATVPPTVRIVADTWGRERVGVVFGWVFAAHQLGAGAAAFGGGLSDTLFGTYAPAFVVAAVLSLAASGLVIAIRRPAPAAAPA